MTNEQKNWDGASLAARPISLAVDQVPLSIDRFEAGFELLLTNFDERRLTEAIRRERRNAVHASEERNLVKLTLPLCRDANGSETAGQVRLSLAMRRGSQANHFVAGSIGINPLVCLRARMGPEHAGPVSLKRAVNVVGPTDAVQDIEHLCCAIIAEGIGVAQAVLSRLLGLDNIVGESVVVWIRAFEATRDLPMPNAIHKAQRLLSYAHRGMRFIERTRYSDATGGYIDAGVATTRAYLRQTGAALKAYPKTNDLLRVEWALDERTAVRREVGSHRVRFDTEAVMALVRGAMDVAREPLQDFELEVLEACRSDATPLDVVRALQPLYDLATSDGLVRGPAPLHPVSAEARKAFDSLMMTGQCTLASKTASARLRACLDGLVGAGVLNRNPRHLSYSLSARLAVGMAM